jgi:uncharacterized DUF497 family protein
VPEISPEIIDWDDGNLGHATRHGVSMAEINQVLMNYPKYVGNRRGRAADYLALGSTDGGREVVVAVSWDGARRSIRPITAWEAE